MKNKNIHLLRTVKPSRLFFNNNKFSKKFELTKGKPFLNGITNTQNHYIYITSDEEIKEGDWFVLDMSHSSHPNEVHQMGNDNWSKTGGIHFCEGNSWIKSCKKIILTTDQDLIKDGIQAIDDEFLEWFVKNPSCEEVDVVEDTFTVGEMSKLPLGTRNLKYKIIIPKEEPKQVLEQIDQTNTVTRGSTALVYKQETLEEANWKVLGTKEDTFFNGAKWQTERMYSEEEVLKLLRELNNEICEVESIKDWFEKFKKK